MGVVDFSVSMTGSAAPVYGRKKPPEIRIAPALGSQIGEWEWAIVEEARATNAKELAQAQVERKVLAQGIERDPLLCTMAAVSALRDIMLPKAEG